MKTNKILAIACVFYFASSLSLSAQTQSTTPAEVPSWIVKNAKESVALFKNELKLTPADSAIFTEEFIKRTLRSSTGAKLVTTPEEKKAVSVASANEYFETLKKRISPSLYKKYIAFINRPKTN
ncbi:MAG: hypothetical protein WCJ61_02260 [Paludibacter sp.]